MASKEKIFQIDGGKYKNVVAVCMNKNPVEALMEISREVSKTKKKVCFVSVDKSFSILSEKFKKEKIDYSNFYFIDCISTMFSQQIKSEQCIYLDSPRALQVLALKLGDAINNYDYIFIDGLNTLISYNDSVTVLHFLNNLMSHVKHSQTQGIYLFSHDTNQEIMEDISLFADKVQTI